MTAWGGASQDGQRSGKRHGGSTHDGDPTPAAVAKAAAAVSAGSRQPVLLRGSSSRGACRYKIIDAAVRQFDFYWSVSSQPF